jgi:hypothetical protein
VAKPLWAGSQVFVSEFEELTAERTDRGRVDIKRSVGTRKSIVERKVEQPGQSCAHSLASDYVTYSSPPRPLMSLRSSPVPLESLPPSPDEQDLGGNHPWHSDDELDHDDVSATEHLQHRKGKAKLYANGATDELSHYPDPTRTTEAYPPTSDEDAETRRVQEVRACPHSCLFLTSFSVEPKALGNCRTTALEGSARILIYAFFHTRRCYTSRHVVLVTTLITPSHRWRR